MLLVNSDVLQIVNSASTDANINEFTLRPIQKLVSSAINNQRNNEQESSLNLAIEIEWIDSHWLVNLNQNEFKLSQTNEESQAPISKTLESFLCDLSQLNVSNLTQSHSHSNSLPSIAIALQLSKTSTMNNIINSNSLAFQTLLKLLTITSNDESTQSTLCTFAAGSQTTASTKLSQKLIKNEVFPKQNIKLLLTTLTLTIDTNNNNNINNSNQFNSILSNPNLQKLTKLIPIYYKFSPFSLTSSLPNTHKTTKNNVPNRKLLSSNITNNKNNTSNSTQTTLETTVECNKSWTCDPWPIYVAFVSGILVTLLMSQALGCVVGSHKHENDIYRIIDKMLHAGITETNNTMNRVAAINTDPNTPHSYENNNLNNNNNNNTGYIATNASHTYPGLTSHANHSPHGLIDHFHSNYGVAASSGSAHGASPNIYIAPPMTPKRGNSRRSFGIVMNDDHGITIQTPSYKNSGNNSNIENNNIVSNSNNTGHKRGKKNDSFSNSIPFRVTRSKTLGFEFPNDRNENGTTLISSGRSFGSSNNIGRRSPRTSLHKYRNRGKSYHNNNQSGNNNNYQSSTYSRPLSASHSKHRNRSKERSENNNNNNGRKKSPNEMNKNGSNVTSKTNNNSNNNNLNDNNNDLTTRLHLEIVDTETVPVRTDSFDSLHDGLHLPEYLKLQSNQFNNNTVNPNNRDESISAEYENNNDSNVCIFVLFAFCKVFCLFVYMCVLVCKICSKKKRLVVVKKALRKKTTNY